MTHEKWIALTNDQQRLKIAKLCGLRAFYHMDGVSWVYGYRRGSGEFQGYVPKYLTDLNAMHEAEKRSTIFESWRDTKAWMNNLFRCSVLKRLPESDPDWVWLLQLEAAQRAEAFVLTLEPETP